MFIIQVSQRSLNFSMRGTRQSNDQTLSTRFVISLCFHYWAWVKDFLLLIFVISVQVQFKYKQAFSRSKKLAMPWFGKNITVGPNLWQNSSTLTILNTSPFTRTNTSFIYSSAAAASFLQRLFQYLKELPCQHQALCTPTTLDLFNPIWIYFGAFFGIFQTLGHSLVLIQWEICQSKKSCSFFGFCLSPLIRAAQNLNRETADHAHSTLTDGWRFKISIFGVLCSTENNWPTESYIFWNVLFCDLFILKVGE